MIDYLTTDSFPEIVAKNKQNVLYLLDEFSQGGISYKDLVAKVEANAIAAAKGISDAAAAQAKADSHDQAIRNNATAVAQAQADATKGISDAATAQAKADSHDQPIINNAAAALAAQQKADQNAADIVKAVADINANAAAIARIINDGIGGYKGTYRATTGDDFTVLPQTANSKERAITEFPENDEIFYQEWEWNDPDGWTKLGSKTDSHIHSQSAGISLADVARQQDPKIAAAVKALEDKVPKLTDIKYEIHRELFFAERKTTGAFADRTLFSELAIPKGSAILGGTGGVHTTGSIPEITSPYINTIGLTMINGTAGFNTIASTQINKVGNSKEMFIGGDGGQSKQITINTSGTKDKVTTTGTMTGNSVKAEGLEIVAYVYTALKDITNDEMEK